MRDVGVYGCTCAGLSIGQKRGYPENPYFLTGAPSKSNSGRPSPLAPTHKRLPAAGALSRLHGRRVRVYFYWLLLVYCGFLLNIVSRDVYRRRIAGKRPDVEGHNILLNS